MIAGRVLPSRPSTLRKSWGNISFAAGWRPTPPVLETWPWLLNGASVCCHRPADQGVGTGVGGGPATPCPWPGIRGHPATQSLGHARAQAGVLQTGEAHFTLIPSTFRGHFPNPACRGKSEEPGRAPAGPGSPSVPCLRPTYVPRPGSCQSHATGPLTAASR